MKILDANAILRYILNDNSNMSETVIEAVQEGAFTSTEILAEVVYVLQRVYKTSREDISWYIHCILLDINVADAKVIRYALGVYNMTTLDFVDCLLVAYHKNYSADILTFDKKLNTALNKEFLFPKSFS